VNVDPEELPDEEAPEGWRERLAGVAEAALALVKTRLAILGEEVAEKRAHLLRGIVGMVVAAGLGAGALLLFAALLAAVLARLFGNVALGILGALVLYAAGAAVGIALGVRALSRVRPFDFPAARLELSRDWEALRASWSQREAIAEDPGPNPVDDGPIPPRGRDGSLENLEERYRAGAE
jgi:uncharacterized membrane protein YqjE